MDALIYGKPGITEEYIEGVHYEEAKADDIRRDIERHLYEKALIPESRGDVLGMIETIDSIPNTFESLVSQIYLQQVTIPEEFRDQFSALVQVNVDSYNILRNGLRDFFYTTRNPLDNIHSIDEKESESDFIERTLISAIFQNDMEKADKILLKEIVVNVGNVSDLAEISADRLSLAVLKRRT